MQFIWTLVGRAAFWLGSGLTGKVIAFIGKVALASAASYAINKLLAPKLPKDSIGSNPLVMTRNPIANRRVIYGTGRYSGPMLFANVSGSENKYLHIIIALAGHEVEEISGTFWFDDKQVDVPYPGNNTTHPTYAPHVLLNKHRGEAGQTADGQLLSDIPGLWTTSHKLEGIAYIMVRLSYDPQVFPGGIPNITALVRGKKCYDPRDSSTAFTQNPALALRDYLTDTTYGMRATSAEIDDASFIAAANICDESVAIATSFTESCDITSGDRRIVTSDTSSIFPGLAVSGTGIAAGAVVESVDVDGAYFTIDRDPTATNTSVTVSFGDAEPRYSINGAFETDAQPATVIEYILATMAGSLVYVGGKWVLKAGAYETPTVSLDEDDLRGALTVKTRDSIKDTWNGVKGTFSNPVENYQLTDFKGVNNATYVTEDDGELWRDVTMPFVTSHSLAQRLAKIELERARRDITVTMQCKLTALKVQAGDTVAITNAREGWTGKPFVVTNLTFAVADDLTVGCDLALRETDPTIFDFDAETEEQPYEPSTPSDTPEFPPDPDPDYIDIINDNPIDDFVVQCSHRAGVDGKFSGSARASDGGDPEQYLQIDGSISWGGSAWNLTGTYTMHHEGGGSGLSKVTGGSCGDPGAFEWILMGGGAPATQSGTFSGSLGAGPGTADVNACTPWATDGFTLCLPGDGAWSAWVNMDEEALCDENCVAKKDSDPSSCDNQEARVRVIATGLKADTNYLFSVRLLRRSIGSSTWAFYADADYILPTDSSGEIDSTIDVPNEEGYETCVTNPGMWGESL